MAITPREFPICEFDPERKAVIEPTDLFKPGGFPRVCVMAFFRETLEAMAGEGVLKPVHAVMMESTPFPIYAAEVNGQRITVAQAYMGASGIAYQLEALIAHGCDRFIVAGACGVIVPDIAVGRLIVPTSAVRDEGTSYHYLPPSREVDAPDGVIEFLTSALQARNIPHIAAKTWSTDGMYRETPAMVAHRVAEGCVTVEMETAALFAVARFRGVKLGQILYGGDDVSGIEYDERDWQGQHNVRRNLLALAMDIAAAWTEA